MKKLLLLLFLIPNLAQSEEFILVCDGMFNSYTEFGDSYEKKKTIVVKVGGERIEVGDRSYSTKTYSNELMGELKSVYFKDNDLIDVFSVSKERATKDHCAKYDYYLKINRISGEMSESWRQTDPCMDKKYFLKTGFEGKCKKQDRAF